MKQWLLVVACLTGVLTLPACAEPAPQQKPATAAAAPSAPATQTSVAPAPAGDELPSYQKVSGVSGSLSSIGSDTMNNLMTLWAETFKSVYPNVQIQIQGAGSSTAPPALTEGTASFGPMSREMKDLEIEAFRNKHGYPPLGIRVAIDALAVYVHKDNPITGLTLPQVDAIFSVNRQCGYASDIRTWDNLGLSGTWSGRPIQLYGRNSVSGTYGYFKEHALCKGDFKNNVNEQPGSASVVQSISSSLNGIGYSGFGYRTAGVRAVPIARAEGQPFVDATPEHAVSNAYPLARYLYLYVNKKPGTPMRPLEIEFLKLVLSEQGQGVVLKDGYIPVPARIAEREIAKLAR